MYLVRLNKEQKNLFLELAHCLASIDGNFSDTERVMIMAYCNEMQIEFNPGIKVRAINEIIDLLAKECGELERKIIIFEAIGLAMIDSNYDELERKLITSIIDAFEFEYDFGKECEALLSDYIELQNRINGLVLG